MDKAMVNFNTQMTHCIPLNSLTSIKQLRNRRGPTIVAWWRTSPAVQIFAAKAVECFCEFCQCSTKLFQVPLGYLFNSEIVNFF